MANYLSDLIAAGFTDDAGVVLSSGKVYHYEAGTTTLKNLYTDYAGSTPATQPILLDGSGAARVYGFGLYKLVIQDADGAVIQTIDNYTLGGTVVPTTPVAPTKILVSTDRQTTFTVPTYVPGSNTLRVYLDGVRLSLANGDYTESSATQIILSDDFAHGISVASTTLLVEVF